MNVILIQFGNGQWCAFHAHDGQLVAAGTDYPKLQAELQDKMATVVWTRSQSEEA